MAARCMQSRLNLQREFFKVKSKFWLPNLQGYELLYFKGF